MVPADREDHGLASKKPYEKPELTVYGPVVALTQNSGRGGSDNGGKGGKT